MRPHDPAGDPERRRPRATRGSDENFHRPDSAAKAGSSSYEEATPTQDNQDIYLSKLADIERISEEIGETFYTGNKLETVMDRLELEMHKNPLPYIPKANKQSSKRIPRYIEFDNPDDTLEHE